VADRKITDLTALTTPASADVLPIVDVSEAAAADKNKKITVGELFKGVPDGTAAAPAIAFESDDGNGIFLSTTDTVGIATNGSSRMTVSTTAVTSTLPVIVPDGTAAAPSVAFTGSGTDTGVYSPGVDQVAISAGGFERLRITNSGAFNFNSGSTTAAIYSYQYNGLSNVGAAFMDTSNSGTTAAVRFFRNTTSTQVGEIATSTTGTSYNTSSDYRLKENIVPLTGAADRLNQLQVRRFNFIADPDTTVDGFIAHQAQAVVPECVTGEKDAVDADGNPVYQGIDQSKLVPLLTAALQEALAEIESLKARVTALEP